MTEVEQPQEAKPRDWKRILTVGGLILLAAIFSFLNADERIAINIGVTVLYRLSLVGVVFSVFLLGMLTMFLFGLRHDRAVRDALKTQANRQGIPGRALGTRRALEVSQPLDDDGLAASAIPGVPDQHDPDETQSLSHLNDSPEPKPPA